ncbi:PAS domain-containing sensor histidine kinase [Leptolyngbya sp. AN02str]|uniref:PAS domain-containing sensor histidine kinase n=1 Tax=Leptolyngbya sp. AN02str TaxID=3423363 RepID=UPI003D31B94E
MTLAARTPETELDFLRKEVARLTQELQQAQHRCSTLESERDRFLSFFQISTDPLCVANLEGRFLELNPAWQRLLGYTTDELMESSFLNFVHPDDRESTQVAMQALNQGQAVLGFDNRYCCKDGSYRWFSWKAFPLDHAGLVYAIAHDITDRKHIEEALKQEQRFTTAVIENVADGVVACDADGNLKLFNRTAREWHGCDPREVPASEWSRLYSLYEADGITPLATERIPLLRAFTGEQVRNAGMAIAIAGQPPRYILADGNPLINNKGQKIGAIVAMHDITEQRQAQIDVLEKEQFLRSIYEGVEHPIFVVDVTEDGQFLHAGWNPATERITGHSSSNIIGKTSEEIFGEVEGGDMRLNNERCAATGETLVTEAHYDFDGNESWWVTTLNPLKNAQGRVHRIVGTSFNITERVRAETALMQKAQREQRLNQITSQIRSSLDLKRVLETAVQAIRDLLKIDVCQYVWYRPRKDDSYWEVVNEAIAPGIPSMLKVRLSPEEMAQLGQRALEKQLMWIDDIGEVADPVVHDFFANQRQYQAVLALPIHTQSGQIGTIVCAQVSQPRPWSIEEVELMQLVGDQMAIAIDQAALYKQSRNKTRKLEQTLTELQRTQAQLVQSEKMSSLGQLVAGVAHEINNPVNFIYGNLVHANMYTQDILELLKLYQQIYPHPDREILERSSAIDIDFLADDLPKLLASMKVGAERIQQIVLSLRNFSRMDEAEFKHVDIHEGLDSTLMILQNRLKAKSVRIDGVDHHQPAITVIQNYGKLPKIQCYPGQLNQVFMNILANAIDALEERDSDRSLDDIKAQPSQIEITTEVVEQSWIKIRFKDNGVGIPEHIQQHLFNPFFTTKPIGKGTGLGMSISFQIITEKHHGQLECISAPGQGAEFIITIPICQIAHVI